MIMKGLQSINLVETSSGMCELLHLFGRGRLVAALQPMRSNLAHTALRLCLSLAAICAALWPLA
jgi:hypothetical protein